MRPSPATTLSILDPTTLLGREIAEALARALPEARIRWFHTRADAESLITEIAGGAALVPPLDDPDELEGSAVVVVTAPPTERAAGRLLDWLAGNPAVALLDCSQPGVAGTEARCVLDRVPPTGPAHRRYHLADPALAPAVRFVAALAPLEPRALHLTVVCPVAPLGEEALDELARQGAARLSGQPVRKSTLLPTTLAFDVAPATGDRVAALEDQVADLLPDIDRRVHAIDAGVFHGYAATVLVRCEATTTEERARGLLRAAHGFRLARRDELPTTTRAVEHGSTITCGGVRCDGGWVGAWLLGDGLAVAADAAVEIVRSLSAG